MTRSWSFWQSTPEARLQRKNAAPWRRTDADDIRALQKETSDACKLITLKGSPSLGGIRDMSASLARADRGGVLSTEELLRIAGCLKSARMVKNYADGDSVPTVLDPWFFQLMANKYLEV